MTDQFREALFRRYENDGWIQFEGHNCSDVWEQGESCAGWDGFDRRCECGNRRVSWECLRDNDTENVEDWIASAY